MIQYKVKIKQKKGKGPVFENVQIGTFVGGREENKAKKCILFDLL